MQTNQRKQQVIEMLKTEPHDVFLNYALAMELLGENNFEETKQQLEKTLTLNQEYLPCFYQLGQVLEKLNNTTLAIDYYQKGILLATKQNNNKALGELKEALWLLED